MDKREDSRVPGLPGIAGARITIIVPALGAGGTEHVVNLVANHWNSIGCMVTLITLERPDAQPYYDFDPGIARPSLYFSDLHACGPPSNGLGRISS